MANLKQLISLSGMNDTDDDDEVYENDLYIKYIFSLLFSFEFLLLTPFFFFL